MAMIHTLTIGRGGEVGKRQLEMWSARYLVLWTAAVTSFASTWKLRPSTTCSGPDDMFSTSLSF
jgi:hypothetical protein